MRFLLFLVLNKMEVFLICRSNTFLSFTWDKNENDYFYIVEVKEKNSSWNFHENVRSICIIRYILI